MYKLYYLTSDIDNNKPRYIGYTSKSLEERLKGHIRDFKYKKCNSHKVNWIGNVIKNGYDIKIFLLEERETLDEILMLESEYIKPIFNELVNSTTGGEKNKEFTSELRKKLSDITKEYYKTNKPYTRDPNYKLTEETKLKIANSVSGDKNGFYGKTHSLETITHLRDVNSKYKQITYDELFDLYLTQNLKINDIVNQYKSIYKSVQKQMSRFGINKKLKKTQNK